VRTERREQHLPQQLEQRERHEARDGEARCERG
jgi:hypothetical protein